MKFDFEGFSQRATEVYNNYFLYSLDDCLSVFRCYFESFEIFTKRTHPPIKGSQIYKIMGTMPFFDAGAAENYVNFMRSHGHTPMPDITPSTYPDIIQQHFKTIYRNCDYNINHFFSGRIRELRLYELDCGREK